MPAFRREKADLTVRRSFGQAQIEIARQGAESWLAQYRAPGAAPEVRLLDYQIGALEAVESTCPRMADYDQVYLFEYSVLPDQDAGQWIAGDGRFDTDQKWVIEKTQHLGLRMDFWQVQFFILGPCPCC